MSTEDLIAKQIRQSLVRNQRDVDATREKLNDLITESWALVRQLSCKHNMVSDNSGMEMVTETCTLCGVSISI